MNARCCSSLRVCDGGAFQVEDNAAAEPKKPHAKHSRLFFFLKSALAIAVLYFLYHADFLDLSAFFEVARSPSVLMGILLGTAVNVLLSAWRWQLLLKALLLRVQLKKLVLVSYIGQAMNPVLPSAVGGDLVRVIYMMKHYPESRMSGLFSIMVDRATGLGGLVVIGMIAALMHYSSIEASIPWLLPQIEVFAGLLLLGLITAVILFITRHRWKAYLEKKLSGNATLMRIGREGYRIIKLFVQRYREMILCIAISCVIQLTVSVILYLIAQHAGFESVPLWQLILASSLAQLSGLLPVTPGGIGIAEAAFALVLIGLNPDVSAAYSSIFLTYRMLTMLVMLPGMLLYFTRRDY